MTTLKEREVASELAETTTHRILVVDDESSISDLISTSLRFVGFDVKTAASGAQALQVAEEFRPHAIVLDVMLPDLNGFEVFEKFFQLQRIDWIESELTICEKVNQEFLPLIVSWPYRYSQFL